MELISAPVRTHLVSLGSRRASRGRSTLAHESAGAAGTHQDAGTDGTAFPRHPRALRANTNNARVAERGAVLATTLSLEEADLHSESPDLPIAWGAGCHPRKAEAQAEFEFERFGRLVERMAIVGEIGLDTRWSRVPLEMQLRTFRQALAVLARFPRFVSLHSDSATSLVLEEPRRRPIAVPVLHW